LSNVIRFPPHQPRQEPAGEPLCRPVLCHLDPAVRVVDLARALAAGGFSIVFNRASDTMLIKEAPKES